MPSDQHDPSPPPGEPPPGAVEVGHHAPGIAVVLLRGEHDISTAPALASALAEACAHSNVVVDLTDCSFIDSTVVAALITAARTVHARDERFGLVIPPEQRSVARVAQMVRLGEFLSIHTTRDAALASVEST